MSRGGEGRTVDSVRSIKGDSTNSDFPYAQSSASTRQDGPLNIKSLSLRWPAAVSSRLIRGGGRRASQQRVEAGVQAIPAIWGGAGRWALGGLRSRGLSTWEGLGGFQASGEGEDKGPRA